MSILTNPDAMLTLLDFIGGGSGDPPYNQARIGAGKLARYLYIEPLISSHLIPDYPIEEDPSYSGKLSVALQPSDISEELITDLDILRVALGHQNDPNLQSLFLGVHGVIHYREYLDKTGFKRFIAVEASPYEAGVFFQALTKALGEDSEGYPIERTDKIGIRVAGLNRFRSDNTFWNGGKLRDSACYITSFDAVSYDPQTNTWPIQEEVLGLLEELWNQYPEEEGNQQTNKLKTANNMGRHFPLVEITILSDRIGAIPF